MKKISVMQGLNLIAGVAQCAVCGVDFAQDRGPAFFISGSENLVCGACVHRHAPELVQEAEATNAEPVSDPARN